MNDIAEIKDIPRDGGRWPEYTDTMTICIDTHSKNRASGRIYNYRFEELNRFEDYGQLLLTLDRICDDSCRPDRWQSVRQWDGRIKPEKEPPYGTQKPFYAEGALKNMRGSMATLFLTIVFRQHSTMQGKLKYKKQTVSFRSGLELLHLIESLLTDKVVLEKFPAV